MPPSQKLIATSALFAVLLSSCGGTASQCSQLITPINDSQSFRAEYEQTMGLALNQISGAQNLAESQSAAGEYVSAVETANSGVTQLTEKIANANITDDQLLEYRNSYITLSNDWAAALTAAKEAMQLLTTAKSEEDFRDSFDLMQRQINSAFDSIQTIDAQESTLIEGLNTYCAAPAG